MNRMKLVVLTGVVTVICASLLLTGCHRGSPEKIREKAVSAISDKLALDQGQKMQLETISKELLSKANEVRQNREALRQDMHRQLQSDKIDPTALKAAVRAKMADMEGLIDLSIDRLAAFHATLSSEQRTKLAGLVKEWEARGHGRCGHGPLGHWDDDK